MVENGSAGSSGQRCWLVVGVVVIVSIVVVIVDVFEVWEVGGAEYERGGGSSGLHSQVVVVVDCRRRKENLPAGPN